MAIQAREGRSRQESTAEPGPPHLLSVPTDPVPQAASSAGGSLEEGEEVEVAPPPPRRVLVATLLTSSRSGASTASQPEGAPPTRAEFQALQNQQKILFELLATVTEENRDLKDRVTHLEETTESTAQPPPPSGGLETTLVKNPSQP